MTLSASQRLIRRFVSAKSFAAMEAESRAWTIEGACGWRSNVWEAGGIRWKARGAKKRWGKCPGCGRRHGFTVRRGAAPTGR